MRLSSRKCVLEKDSECLISSPQSGINKCWYLRQVTYVLYALVSSFAKLK